MELMEDTDGGIISKHSIKGSLIFLELTLALIRGNSQYFRTAKIVELS